MLQSEHTDSGEFTAHVEDHNDGHEQGADVGDAVGALENDRVGYFDGARVAGWLDALCAFYSVVAAHHCAQR